MVGGMARFDGRTVMVIGHQKGRDTRENVKRNFGHAQARRLPQGAAPDAARREVRLPADLLYRHPRRRPRHRSEERGQANAIAENILRMAGLQTPIVAIVIGEGGSGGALAIGVADRLIMLENSIYSVASPEGTAAILWRDSAKAPEAARGHEDHRPRSAGARRDRRDRARARGRRAYRRGDDHRRCRRCDSQPIWSSCCSSICPRCLISATPSIARSATTRSARAKSFGHTNGDGGASFLLPFRNILQSRFPERGWV